MIDNPNAKFVQLSDDFEHGRISIEDLNKECAYWYLDCFDELKYKYPPSTPQRFLNFKNLSRDEQRSIPKEFWLHPEIKEYLDSKNLIRNENRTTIEKLKMFKQFIPEQDFVSRGSYNEKIDYFESKDFS